MIAACGGRAGPVDDVQGALPRRNAVRVRPGRVARLLGVALPAAEIEGIFSRLDLPFERSGDDFLVTPPSYRVDWCQRIVDWVEAHAGARSSR